MLTIRPAQLEALASGARERFVRAMCLHLQEHFPGRVAYLSQIELQQTVRICLVRAEDYDLVSERDICRYLNLAAHLGWSFDQDPDLLWIRQHLRDPAGGTASERLESVVAEYARQRTIAKANAATRWAAGSATSQSAKQSDRRSRNSLTHGLLYTQLGQESSSQIPPSDALARSAARQRTVRLWNNNLPPLLQEIEG